MSVPQMNYSVPPPRMDVPPPSVVAAIPPPSVPASIPPQITPTAMPLPSGLGAMPPLSMSAAMPCTRVSASAVSAAMPSSQIYNIPPYYNLPSTNQTAPYVPMSTLPPLNMPPPAINYPLNFRSLPPPPPSTYSLPSDASNYSSLNYSGTHIAEDTFTIPPPKFKSLIRDDRGYFYDNTPSRFTHFQDRERHHDLHSLGQYNQSYSSSSSPVQKRHRSPLNSRHKSHSHCDKTYSCRSPSHNSCRSPARRERSPARKERIPARRERSPARRERSPARKERTPSRRVRSPSRKERSPYHREKNLSRRERSPSRRDWSPSHRERSSSHRERSLSRRYHRSPSHMSLKDIDRYYDKRDYRRYESERRHSSPRHRGDQNYRHSNKSHDYYDDRRSHSSPNRSGQHSNRDRSREKSHHSLSGPSKPMTDREKILEEYRKNYCKTSDDLIENMQKWSKEHNSEDEEASKMWYRSSPAELYYAPVENGTGFQQTSKLEQICDTFFEKLILRGRQARPEVDELPPLNTPKGKMCKHHSDDKSSSSSSESEDDCLDDEGLQGFTDTIMFELQRKQSHPRRLHPEMWFNNTGEMNGGLLCRCSARARRQGMRHGVYVGEGSFPKCIPNQNNIDKLYHYRITVSPPTNFLIKSPTIIAHDEHEFLFSGFSMFSHYKLGKLPTCKVIRFNIEYTILYVEEPAPLNFTIKELDLFEEFLFYELLELVDLDLGKATETSCSQFHFMPRFVRYLPESGCEVLSMCEVLKYLIQESGLLIPPENLETVHAMDHYTWQKFVDRIKGMIVTYPGKKPCSVRVDQLDRSPPTGDTKDMELNKYFPEIVHFGIRPPQLSYAGNPEYQKAWRYYVKYRHLIANMAKPSLHERQKLAAKEATLQEMRTQSKMKRDVTVAISSEGFHTTGLMCDIVQHAMLIPVLVKHLRFHKSLDCLEKKMDYVFKQRALLQTALTHPSYRENFGTNPDHARNSLTNCGIRQPEYGDRRIHYTRKKGIVTLINIMSRFGKHSETESEIKHNERLEFLGDAVVEFLSSIHLFRMFPGLAEGGLATYRASIVQNQHLAHLAKNIGLEQFMLYAHGSDLCRDVVMRHAMANCFEALMGALFLDAGLEVSVADRVFALALWHNEPEMLETWMRERPHPLQEQEPLGDRQYIADIEFLQKLTKFEDSIGLQFKHIRLLARAFTDRSVGFTHLTLGSNQRLEFLGDTVVQLVVSDRLYRHFPDHHEGHLSLLRSSLVNNRTQAMICDDLNMVEYATYNNPKAKPTTKKHKADLLEAFLGALYIDKNLEYCQAFCNACLFPRLQEFIMNQDWNDPKSKLQQCCLTLRSMEGGEPDIPVYKVIQCLGPTNTRVYTVGVYFRGKRLAAARGHSIQEAEMNAAEEALSCANELFPQLDHQKRVIAKSMPKKKGKKRSGDSPTQERTIALKQKRIEDKVPKAYKLEQEMQAESSDESIINPQSDEETARSPRRKSEDSGLDSDEGAVSDDKYNNVQVSSLLSDMHRLRDEMILKNEYEKLKEKCRRLEADE